MPLSGITVMIWPVSSWNRSEANILQKDGDNWERGLQSIYAAAYAVLDDGTEEGTVIMGNRNVSYSMADVLRNVDHIWPRLTEGQKTQMKELTILIKHIFGLQKSLLGKKNLIGLI